MGCHCLLQETYSSICEIDGQQEFALWLRKLKQCLCIYLEEWNEEGDEREVQKGGDICIYLWLIHVDVQQKLTQYCKVIILQLKINL